MARASLCLRRFVRMPGAAALCGDPALLGSVDGEVGERHPEPLESLLRPVFFDPVGFRAGSGDDDELIGGERSQGVLDRLQRIGISNFRLDARRALDGLRRLARDTLRLRTRLVHGPSEPLQPGCVRGGGNDVHLGRLSASVLPHLLAQGTLIHRGDGNHEQSMRTHPGFLPGRFFRKTVSPGARPNGPHLLTLSLCGFDDLFDPAESGDRVREADRRQGKQADVAHFFTALALGECAARM
jgi:hypothetical protein